MRTLLLSLIAALTVASPVAANPVSAPGASAWEIGPVIRGRNYSVGMPLHPAPSPGDWSFDFPVGSAEAGHVHYVTFRPASMAGKSRIVVRYRIDAERGTRFVPQAYPGSPAIVSLYLQRRGDTWSAKGRYNFYRWYAPFATARELSPGVHEVSIALDDPDWVSVMGPNAGKAQAEMLAALADPDRLGLVFGSSEGRGHGVFATRPARFTLLSFRIL